MVDRLQIGVMDHEVPFSMLLYVFLTHYPYPYIGTVIDYTEYNDRYESRYIYIVSLIMAAGGGSGGGEESSGSRASVYRASLAKTFCSVGYLLNPNLLAERGEF